jgi:hypothetical protein
LSFLPNLLSNVKSYFTGGNGAAPDPDDPKAYFQNQEQTPEPKETPRLSTQLKLSTDELKALAMHIDRCRYDANSDHQVRLDRCAWQERQWREKVGLPGGEEGKSNFLVQLLLALTFAKHAREVEALFGSNPTITATERAPSGQKLAKKASLWMKWQVYENMRAMKPISLWTLRRLKHGRSFAYVPWSKKFFNKTHKGTSERVVYHEGPEVHPLGNDEIILPASVEGVTGFDSVQTAEWVIRRYWVTPAEMLFQESEPGGPQNEEGDFCQGVSEDWDRILCASKQGYSRDYSGQWGPSSLFESDLAEGVARDESSTDTGKAKRIEIYEWHGKWRRWADDESLHSELSEQPNFSGSQPESESHSESGQRLGNAESALPEKPAERSEVGDASREPGSHEGTTPPNLQRDRNPQRGSDTFFDTDGIRKYKLESDLIVRYAPALYKCYGVQDAAEVYPDTPIKRPILELALLNDGQYWCMGLFELAEELQKEMTVLVNRAIQAITMSIGPPIAASPDVGENAQRAFYEPFQILWTTNPQGMQVMNIRPNTEPFAQLWELFKSLYEQLTGITNFTFGRSMDQPNAPRTLGGQRLVMGAGDVRLALDMRMLGEDLRIFLDWVWDLGAMFGTEQTFFRVAEGDSQGLFAHGELKEGWAELTAKDRQARYDFSLSFADEAAVKEAKKQEMIALAQALSQSVWFAQDPVAQYRFSKDLCDAFGKDIANYASEPAPMPAPKTPEQAWIALLEGEEVVVNENEDDQKHIAFLEHAIEQMYMAPEEDRNMPAMMKAMDLIKAHTEQMQRKQQMQEFMAGMQNLIAAATQGQQGTPSAGGIPAGPAQAGGMAQ